MRARKMVAKGFTLVEILIVVVILGILAAIVIPQFTNASEAAKYSNMVSQLQTVRSQIALYQNQHNDAMPDLSSNWDDLTGETNITGAAPTGTDIVYGPYLQKVPVNPFTDSSSVGANAAAASASVGWVWDGGILKAVMPDAKAEELGADEVNDVVVY
ncbi:MAG: type II secretion system protein [Phycisphaerales bacterium JB063]